MVKGTWKALTARNVCDENLMKNEETNLLVDQQWDFFPLADFTLHKKLPIDKTKVIVMEGQSGVPK